MFSGKLVNRFKGISKKGNEFCTVDVFVDLDPGHRVLFKAFIDQELYKRVEPIPLDSIVTLKCGVNGFGNLCVKDIISGK